MMCDSDIDLGMYADTSQECSTSPTSNSDVDPELPRSDYNEYWYCVQCGCQTRDPKYQYCRKCYTARKNFFPIRPKPRPNRCGKKQSRQAFRDVYYCVGKDCTDSSVKDPEHDSRLYTGRNKRQREEDGSEKSTSEMEVKKFINRLGIPAHYADGLPLTRDLDIPRDASICSGPSDKEPIRRRENGLNKPSTIQSHVRNVTNCEGSTDCTDGLSILRNPSTTSKESTFSTGSCDSETNRNREENELDKPSTSQCHVQNVTNCEVSTDCTDGLSVLRNPSTTSKESVFSTGSCDSEIKKHMEENKLDKRSTNQLHLRNVTNCEVSTDCTDGLSVLKNPSTTSKESVFSTGSCDSETKRQKEENESDKRSTSQLHSQQLKKNLEVSRDCTDDSLQDLSSNSPESTFNNLRSVSESIRQLNELDEPSTSQSIDHDLKIKTEVSTDLGKIISRFPQKRIDDVLTGLYNGDYDNMLKSHGTDGLSLVRNWATSCWARFISNIDIKQKEYESKNQSPQNKRCDFALSTDCTEGLCLVRDLVLSSQELGICSGPSDNETIKQIENELDKPSTSPLCHNVKNDCGNSTDYTCGLSLVRDLSTTSQESGFYTGPSDNESKKRQREGSELGEHISGVKRLKTMSVTRHRHRVLAPQNKSEDSDEFDGNETPEMEIRNVIGNDISGSLTEKRLNQKPVTNEEADGLVRKPTDPTQIKGPKSEEDDSNLCPICLSSPKNGVFRHTRTAHIYGCYSCSVKSWRRTGCCVLCRQKVSNVLKLDQTL